VAGNSFVKNKPTETMEINKESIQKLATRYRTNLINSLSGPRVAHLIGTVSDSGVENLAIFSSVFHLGADPALLGMVCRPDSVDRHTLDNIRKTGVYTINLVTASHIDPAHQTSARYPAEVSEFEAVGLSSEYIGDWKAPFVEESPLKVALKFREEISVTLNGTHIIIGEIMHIHLDEKHLDESGRVDVFAMNPVVCVGLDTYGKAKFLKSLPYAKP